MPDKGKYYPAHRNSKIKILKLPPMEKMVGRTQYNTARDTKIVRTKGSSLFITSTEKFYLYLGEGQIQVMEMDEVRDWVKNNWMDYVLCPILDMRN